MHQQIQWPNISIKIKHQSAFCMDYKDRMVKVFTESQKTRSYEVKISFDDVNVLVTKVSLFSFS